MSTWFIAATTIVVIALFSFFWSHEDWSTYQLFTATALFAIFLKLKD